jgi:hypothetical protein
MSGVVSFFYRDSHTRLFGPLVICLKRTRPSLLTVYYLLVFKISSFGFILLLKFVLMEKVGRYTQVAWFLFILLGAIGQSVCARRFRGLFLPVVSVHTYGKL